MIIKAVYALLVLEGAFGLLHPLYLFTPKIKNVIENSSSSRKLKGKKYERDFSSDAVEIFDDESKGTIIDVATLENIKLIDENYSPNYRAGFVSIIGSPNVGKSTLMNHLIGDKLSIVTSKAQTTRHKIRGIISGHDFQIIYNDTPGVLLPKYELQEGMMASVKEAINDGDVILFVTDIFEKKIPEETILRRIQKSKKPIIVAINKIDLFSDQNGPVSLSPEKEDEVGSIEDIITRWKNIFPSGFICPISALHGTDTENLIQEIRRHLPKSPPLYDPDAMSDRSMRFFAGEIIREKVYIKMGQEIPYCSEVVIQKFIESDNMITISAKIMVDRDSQKGMMIGKGGSNIKIIGIEARKSLEEFFGSKIFLELSVDVDKDWRKSIASLKQYGYL